MMSVFNKTRSLGAKHTRRAARGHFDREADAYESGHGYDRLEQPRAQAIGLLELGPSDRLLDIGCATGATLRRLAPVVDHAAGVDLSPRMIQLAREHAARQPNLEFAVADSAQLPFADNSFTAALCTFSFHHYPQPLAAAQEIARVLKGSGRLVLADASSDRWALRIADLVARHREPGHVRFYRSHELTAFLDTAGFERTTVQAADSWFAILTALKPANDQ